MIDLGVTVKDLPIFELLLSSVCQSQCLQLKMHTEKSARAENSNFAFKVVVMPSPNDVTVGLRGNSALAACHALLCKGADKTFL